MKTTMSVLLLVLVFLLPYTGLSGTENVVEPIPFEKNDSLETIREKIKHNKYNFTVGHNWVFDMSPEEKETFYGRHRRVEDGPSVYTGVGPLADHLGKKQLPASFDWRNYQGKSYIGPVRNQGSCGSCYAFGACAAAEGTYNFATGRYGANRVDFSESFIAWCLGSLSEYYWHFYGCDGADYDYYELQALVDYGVTYESNFPYQTSDPLGCTHWDDPRIKFQGWYRIDCNDIDAIKTAIMTYGVLDVAVYVSGAFEAYSGGIFEDTSTSCSSSPCYYTQTNHAVALVGWDDAEGVFILRNSWGDSWGENGYMRIKYTSARVACEATYLVYQVSDSLRLTSPNGGESWMSGTSHNITWTSTGSVGNVKIQYSTNNGNSWNTIVSSTANDGLYGWTVPNIASSQCLVKISDASDDRPNDESDAVFSITQYSESVQVTSPNGGENLTAGANHNITWTSSGTVGNVKIEYSVNNGSSWNTIVSSTSNDGLYGWTVPNYPSSQCLVKVSEAADGRPNDVSNAVFSIVDDDPPSISLDRTQLSFGAVVNGTATGAQMLIINNSGGGTLNWSVSSNSSWLNFSPSSGIGAGVTSVSVNHSGLSTGTYSGTIKVSDSNASNSPLTVSVSLTVNGAGQSQEPFGVFASPANNSTVRSSIPVTGWALDDIEVKSVKIYNGTSFVGDAVFVDGARPDVQADFPSYPYNSRSGWGYMLLTNFLPGGGNGTYHITAKAIDAEGNEVTLGTKTIYCNNANAVKPFGAIDTPTQGGLASGNNFFNWGWVLTPQPNSIPKNGSTINVWVDSVNLGHPTYNLYRADIANLFPGYANSNGAAGYFNLDTTAYDNGVHNIYWTATDSGGNTDGIGSRYFTILNTGSDVSNSQYSSNSVSMDKIKSAAVDSTTPVLFRKGFRGDKQYKSIHPGKDGAAVVYSRELERIECRLGSNHGNANQGELERYSGYLKVGKQLQALPVGSHLDASSGAFSWQPGPGFIGNYDLVFFDCVNHTTHRIRVKISPKYSNLEEK